MVKEVALVFDKFLVEGGGERIFGLMAETFPNSDIYALNAHPREFWEKKFSRRIITPPLSFLFRSRYAVIILYPLACFLMTFLSVNAKKTLVYSSTCGKYIHLNSKINILYSNYPNRGIYDTKAVIKNHLFRGVISPFIAVAKYFEVSQLRKYSSIYSISKTSQCAMQSFTGLSSDVLICPYNRGFLEQYSKRNGIRSLVDGHTFVLVSRLEPEKDIDYIIDAFSEFDFELKVIGSGSQLSRLSAMAPDNVKFLGFVEDADLVGEMLDCTAVIFASNLEYSLVPIEANSLGIPVVAYSSAAAREILVDVENDPEFGTAVFYDSVDSKSLGVALNVAINRIWRPENIKLNANRFDPDVFKQNLRDIMK